MIRVVICDNQALQYDPMTVEESVGIKRRINVVSYDINRENGEHKLGFVYHNGETNEWIPYDINFKVYIPYDEVALILIQDHYNKELDFMYRYIIRNGVDF